MLNLMEKMALQRRLLELIELIKGTNVIERMPLMTEALEIINKLKASMTANTQAQAQEVEPEPDDGANASLKAGNTAIVFTPKGFEVKTVYRIVELSKVIPSHTTDGKVNAIYSEELQPRDRERKTSLAQVDKIAGSLNPKRLTSSDLTSHGSPIVGEDLMVESGNGRTLAITKAYRSGKASEYRQYLVDNARKWGFNPLQVDSLDMPVLVRVRKTAVDREQFARESNVSDLQSMSATEQAFADSEMIDDNTMALFSPSDSGDLFSRDNKPFIDAFVSKIGLEQSASLFDSNGNPNRQLRERMKSAIFVKAYKNKSLVELAIEADDPEITNIINALGASAPAFAEMSAINGELHKQLSDGISDSLDAFSYTAKDERSNLAEQAMSALVRATELVRESKQKGVPLDELLSQNDMFSEGDPASEALAMFIQANNRSAKRMAFAFKALAESINKELINQGSAIGDLFGDTQELTLVDVLTQVNKDVIAQYGNDASQIELDRINLQANASAQSEQSDQDQPTQGQKQVGNYKKGRVKFGDFDVTIENPIGSTRSGVSESGVEWSIKLKNHYGDLQKTKGADGDPIDVFLGDNPNAEFAYIVDQVDSDSRKFDEHKIMLGFDGESDAKRAYFGNYDQGWQGLGAITKMPIAKFKEWIKSSQKQPVSYSGGESAQDDTEQANKSKVRSGLNPEDYEGMTSDDLKVESFTLEQQGYSLGEISEVMDHWLSKNVA
uniref:Phage protein n=2 Tax=Vibrio TaxID=662 RepID=A0A0H3ZLL3_9VIBR|nr:Phage protein [Vibrio cyclitrophicus]AKN38233.1 hypothetical protein [Vibrio splendidus]